MTALRTLALQIAVMGVFAAILAGASGVWKRDFPIWLDARAITYDQAVALGQRAIWIDARSVEHYRKGHAPGAINLTERAWDAGIERFLSAWQPEQTIVIYCDSGGCRTGHHVATHLERDLGAQPRVLVGGWGTLQQQQRAAP